MQPVQEHFLTHTNITDDQFYSLWHCSPDPELISVEANKILKYDFFFFFLNVKYGNTFSLLLQADFGKCAHLLCCLNSDKKIHAMQQEKYEVKVSKL